MWLKIKNLFSCKRGSLLIFVMVFGTIAFTIIITGVAGYAIFENRASNYKHNRDLALQIAEAGANYYRWHLAHSPTDYKDGTEDPGPYIHEYHDKDGDLIGYFSLEIDEPLSGSSVVTVRSTGWTISQPDSQRTIQIRMGSPSLTDYTFLSQAGMSFSFTTVVHGPVHSNNEIRFDGTTDSWVRSHIRVQGGGGPKSFWQFPVPEIDFYSVTSDLRGISDMAENGGIHLTSSGGEGYHIVFNHTNYDLYRVTTRDNYYGEGRWKRGWSGLYWDGNVYSYDIGNQVFLGNFQIPNNGIFFIEDDTWVEGEVNGRVSIGVGRFPVQAPYKKLYINNNLIYHEKSSDDVIGLLCQGDIVVPFEVPNDMEINAAMLSQFGKIYRPYYYDDIKNSLTVFGSQISYEGGGWKYVWGFGHVVSGFVNTNHIYDANLRYYPPPGFPVGSTYNLLSWEEI